MADTPMIQPGAENRASQAAVEMAVRPLEALVVRSSTAPRVRSPLRQVVTPRARGRSFRSASPSMEHRKPGLRWRPESGWPRELMPGFPL